MLLVAAAVAAGAALALLAYTARLAAIGTAYAAKMLCSGVFVSQRAPQSLLRDLTADDLALLRLVEVQADREAREVTAAVFGLLRRKAVYREGAGCTLVHEGAGALPAAPGPKAADARLEPPAAEATGPLQAALDWAFAEPDAKLARRTRAVVVVHKGRWIAERYADGFSKDTRFIGWSMSKSAINALLGVLVREGGIALKDPVPIGEWQGAGDPRRRITWEHLLRMTSGLRFDEDYGDPLADVTYMLLAASDAGAYAAAKPLRAQPGERWSYSSGSTNLIVYAMRRVLGDARYAELPRRALFEPLGMSSALIEPDASGTYVGSSFMHASARDWARLGLLYLNDGEWAGRRLLPEGWVAYTRSPEPTAPGGQYGAHFWLQLPPAYRCGTDPGAVPADAFHAVGHEGQFVTSVPSRELVLVRLGFTRYPCAWDHRQFLHRVLQAIDVRTP